MEDVYIGIIVSSLCTILGAVPAVFLQNISHRHKDNLLAYTAGIMVAAATYGLIPSTLKISNLLVLSIGIILGTLVLTLLDYYLPHIDLDHSSTVSFQTSAPLLFIAIALHNVPEGLSVGVSYASDYQDLGPVVSFAIALQNIPEGFLIALFLIANYESRFKAFLHTAITGLIELISSMIGYHFTGTFLFIVPYGLAFAAGAMLFIVYKELIPESHGDGNETSATFSFIFGLLSMIALTNWFR